jgi:release factor glutamine methyltransferase
MMTNKSELATVGESLDVLTQRLDKTGQTPGLDARSLLARLMDRSSAWVLAHREAALTASQSAALESMVARLESGVPLPYVLGKWEFYNLQFILSKDVLIPRPETELLVERAIAWLQAHPDRRHAIDVGTGSGCIGIALAFNIPDLQVLATDISGQALEIARRNAVNHGVAERMEFLQCDLFPPKLEFDLIAANLPYIPTKTLHKLSIFGREPTLALDGGSGGLDIIRRLLTGAPDRLVPGGLLLVEIEASEGPPALSLAWDAFANAEIHLHKDLSGRDRILEIQV